MMVRLKGKTVDVVTVQMYMPTTERKDEEVDTVHERKKELLHTKTKDKNYTLITGDWNAVGECKEDNICRVLSIRIFANVDRCNT